MPPSNPAHSVQGQSISVSAFDRCRLGNLPFSRRVRVEDGSAPRMCPRCAEFFGGFPMKVSEAMTRDVWVASPDQTLREVARIMADLDTGVVPVGENDRLAGMITDRDIAIRGVAEGRGPDATVRDVMTPDVRTCFEDEDVQDVARTMAQNQVRR